LLDEGGLTARKLTLAACAGACDLNCGNALFDFSKLTFSDFFSIFLRISPTVLGFFVVAACEVQALTPIPSATMAQTIYRLKRNDLLLFTTSCS
jgi:hypothetical protein